MKKTLIILTAMLLCATVFAQHRRPTPERKFIYLTSVGYATGLGEIHLMDDNNEEFKTIQNHNFDISVNQLLGYQINPYFQLGLGAGFDFWKHTAFIPIYLNVTVNFTKTKFVPLFYTNLGYSLKWYYTSVPENADKVVHGAKRGPMGEAGLGFRFHVNEKLSILFAACYKTQYSQILYSVTDPGNLNFATYATNRSKNLFYHFAGVRLGLMY